MSAGLPVLVEVTRATTVEARHHGAVIAVEPDGTRVAGLGDEDLVTSTRSSIKPIQAIPLITSGAADHFHLTSREIAVACASHSGEPLHTFAVARILARIGLDENALACGAHRPYSEETAVKLEREHLSFSQLHNNCSGKHAAMLATAVHRHVEIAEYTSPGHPVQQAITSTLMTIAGLSEVPGVAIDGCNAPTFGVPLRALALAFGRMVNPWMARASDPKLGEHFKIAEAQKRIVAAMTAHPELVAGTKGRMDTDLIRAGRGKLIAKVGAEAVYCVGVLPCERHPRGLGVAIKIADGAKRALEPAVIESLIQLGVLDETAQQELSAYRRPQLLNHAGAMTGEVRSVFSLTIYR
jgi:L-asparaginase II